MKGVVLLSILFCFSFSFSQSILERQAEKTKEKIKQRAENKVEREIDKSLDRAEEEIENSVKGEKESKSQNNSNNNTTSESSRNTSVTDGTSSVASTANFKAYSKFDFIPGEKVFGYEDFSQDEIGDFPAKWNTNSSGEIVKFNTVDGHWINFANSGIFYPEFINELPENFTLEFDMLASENFSEMQSGLAIFFPEFQSRNLKFDYHFSNNIQVGSDIHPFGDGGASSIWVIDYSNEQIMSNTIDIKSKWKVGQINRVSIWRQKTRLRIYINETKVWDIPRAFYMDVKYSLLFGTNIWEGKVYVSNLRLAEGAPDTRNKLFIEGKIVSRGILFDVNSDKIKPESYGTLQDIAKTLNELPDVRVKIVGHTDADGDDHRNLELSKKRSESVKQILIKEFNVATERIETDGKGESEPVDSNATQAGKANNRRVEFLKI